MGIGDEIVVYGPPSGGEHESFLKGRIIDTLARNPVSGHALHVIEGLGFKWDLNSPWGEYDGAQNLIVIEAPNKPFAGFLINEGGQSLRWPQAAATKAG